MPTSTRGGATAPPLPVGPPPQPRPQLTLPPEPQHPALAAAGFQGGINAFNQAVAAVVQAHRDAYGTDPSPGLTLDVARSDVPEHQYATLFTVPKDPVTARMQGVLAQHDAQNPTTVRPDGLIVAHTPLTARLQTAAQDAFNHGDQVTPETATQLQQEHPWVPVEAGFLPIKNFGALVDALGKLDKQGVGVQNGQVTVGGKTLSQYQNEVGLAGDTTPVQGTGTYAGGTYTQTSQAITKYRDIDSSLKTVKQAQQDLVANYPAFFTGLTSDGNFNQDWVRAVARFQSSATYYRSATDQLAKDNHFDTAGAFAKAWQAKQNVIRDNPSTAQFYSAVPLAFFGNGKSVINYLDGDTHGWGFANVLTVGLHSIVGVAKTALFGSAAAVNGAKADLAGVSAYFEAVLPSYLGGNGQGQKEAAARSEKVLREHPSYLRIFYPDLAAHPTGALGAIDVISNFAGDIILGNRLVIGGEAVKIGDEAALASHRYFSGASQLAFNALKKRGIEGVGEASRVLQGGEGLNVAVADSVKSGEMTLGQYRSHIADLYHHGQTEIAEPAETVVPPKAAGTVTIHASETPNGSVLSSLRTKQLPNPSLKAQQVKQALDELDQGLRNSGLKGTDNAANMFDSVRELVARAAPKNDVRRIYDAKTPDDIYNWVVRNLDDRELAYKARNDFVVARANQDIPKIQDLNKSLMERYAAEHPNVSGRPTPLESSGPESEAEGLANFKFISGREKDATGVFDRLGQRARRINSNLLSAARFHRQVIISGAPLPGGESLFWKHAIADTGRRFVGGGGVKFGLSAEQKAAQAETSAFFKDNPSALSDFSAQRAAAEQGEVAWLTRSRPEQYVDFNTADHLEDGKYLEGAGAYLRHMVTDDALNAYRASSATDKTALFRHVWHSKLYQNLIAKSPDFQKDAAALSASGAKGDDLKALLSNLKKSYAQDWTDALWTRYRSIDDAGDKAGATNALEQAAQVAREHPGVKIDKALGQFVKDNQLAFDVREAPVKGSMFDGWMSRWTGKLLTFNKLNRVTFFDHIFYDTYRDLAGAGWERADAVTAASALAKQQTIYHMLDFSNMLQVEQNLRWLSYYATKHRLYWTWIGKQFTRKPLLAAAVSDIAQHLDAKGNLNVTIGGHRLDIPAARLVWANNTEYPETSPIVETLFRTGKDVLSGEPAGNAVASAFASETATSGNVFTRQDQGIALLGKYVGMLTGKAPATFGLAVNGMSPVQRAVFNEEMHNVILAYRSAHDGRYPSEAYAVKATLLRSTGNEVWRTNLFLPILPQTGKPTAIQNLISQFGEIQSPVKRRAFLAKHPEISDYFGASSDQDVFLHEQPLWDQFNAISKQRDLQLTKLREQVDKQGYTTELAHEYKQLSARYSVAIENLRKQDARTWKGDATYPAGRVADNGEIQTEGPWASKLDGDPLAARAFLHEAFPGIGAQQLDKHTIGQTILDLQNESTRIRTLGWKQLGYPDAQHAKDRLSQITQTVDVFRSMPGNATAAMIDAYYSKFVDPYIARRDKLTIEQAKASSADKNVVYAAARAIKEQYDHPVLVRDPVSGKDVKFPSPVSFGFTMLPPVQYHAALAGAVASRWQDITGYEKTLLGVKTPPNVAEGWAAYQKTVEEWRQAPANAGHSLQAVQKASLARQIDKAYPGFYKDYLFAQQPKIRRYESTSLYQGMPAGQKQLFDQYIGGPAKALAQAIKQSGSGAARMAYWRDYVRTQIAPWLADHKQLAAELQLYGPDFLNTLPSAG